MSWTVPQSPRQRLCLAIFANQCENYFVLIEAPILPLNDRLHLQLS